MNLVTQLTDSFTIKHVSIINPARKMALQGVEYSTHINDQGRQVDAEPKPYQQPYFAESRQRIIFEYSISRGFEWDKKELSDDDMEKLIPQCGFNFLKGKTEGDPILKGNPHNAMDPFFSHEKLAIDLIEFDGIFDFTLPINKIRYAMLKADKRFLVIENQDEIPEPDQIPLEKTFVVTRRTIIEAQQTRNSDMISSAIVAVSGLDLKLLKIIAQIWGIQVDENTSEEALKKQLNFHILDKKFIPGTKKTYAQSLKEHMAMDNKQLTLKSILINAKKLSVIRATKVGFSYQGQHLGMNDEEIESFFLKPENAEYLVAIQASIANGKHNE